MSLTTEAVCVSRRAHLKGRHIAQAVRIGAVPLYVEHTTGTYADAVNEALRLAGNPVVLKVDDHDTYPADHAAILKQWQPGVLLYGVCDWVGCDGTNLGRKPSLCASALPSDISVTSNSWGQISGSVMAQCKIKEVETGVVKYVCPGDWSWGPKPGSFRKVVCAHW